MKFLVSSFSSTGHVNSVGPIVANLRARNHEVVWLTGKGARQAVENFGARFVCSEYALDWHAKPLATDPGSSGLEAAVSLCRAIYVDSFSGLVQDLRETLAWFHADVIITDLGGHGAGALCEMGGPVYCTIFHVPACHWDHNPDNIVHAPVDDDVSPFSYWIGTPQHWRVLKPLMDLEREKVKLPPLPASSVFKDLAISSFLNLVTTTPSLEFPEQLNEPQSWKIGPVFGKQVSYDGSAWLSLVQKNSYVVHVTQGTFNPETTDSKNLIEPTFEAFKNEKDILVIATGAGLHQRYVAGEFPPNVYCEDFIPHAHLLPHVNVMITNAGFGGVLAALNNGVPLVCAGRGQDKADVSDLVEWRKVGINLKTNFPTPGQISKAVSTIRDNEAYSTRARKFHHDFASHDAPNTASDLLERLAITKQPVLKSQGDLGIFHENRREIPALKRRVADVIQDHVGRTPDKIAVEAHDGCLTYSELAEAASMVAHMLASKGIKPGDMVPTCFSKGKLAIVMMLAMQKARAAFVPLDPSNPTARLQEIIADVQPKLVLVSPDNQQKLSKINKSILVLRGDNFALTEYTNGNDTSLCFSQSEGLLEDFGNDQRYTSVSSDKNQGADDIAYIIFTSGSTGKPKGVVIDNQAICTSLAAQNASYGIDENSRMFQCASLSFDISMLEIFGTLMAGGCVCVPQEEEKFDDIVGCMRRLRVNAVFLTPSLARLIVPQSLPELKTLIIGGEVLHKDTVLAWGGRINVFNAYGPTEASVLATVYPIETATSPHDIVGKAMACNIWVVDTNDYETPLAEGEVGELLIEGLILAKGYLNDDEKTRHAFISPSWLRRFRKRNNVRAYRTGDLVQIDSKSRVRYIERKDLQVKVNGFRVEIGEVEHHISAVLRGDIRSAAIVPKSGTFSDKLVGVIMPSSSPKVFLDNDYIADDVVNEENAFQVQNIQDLLRERLPSYMIPSTFVRINLLPMSVSGKLNRKRITQLIERIQSNIPVEKHDNEASKPVEMNAELAIIHVLREFLPQKSVDINLSWTFKQLGGDSVIGMGVAMRLRSYGLKIRYSDLVGSRSLSQIANECSGTECDAKISSIASLLDKTKKFKITTSSEPDSGNTRTGVHLNGISEVLEESSFSSLAPIQEMYFEYLQWPKRFHSSQTLHVRDRTRDEVAQSIADLVRKHEMLRARFKRFGTSWKQRIERGSEHSYSISFHHDLSTGGMVHAISRAHESIDIIRGPIFAAVLFLDSRDHVEYVHFIAHHLVIDLVSWQIITRELEASFNMPYPTEQTSTSYIIWQQVQEEYGRTLHPDGLLPGRIPLVEVAYWSEFDSSDSLLRANSARNSLSDIISETFELSMDTTNRLYEKCAESATIEVVDALLACFLLSFYNTFPDCKDICVWNQVHGRERVWDDDVDIEGTVGWFSIFVPIFLGDANRSEKGNSLGALVESVKKYRDSILGQGLPYFTSRFFNAQGREDARTHMPMELVFNYMGKSAEASSKIYRSFTPTTLNLPGSEVQEIDPGFKLTHVLDVVVEVDERGRLKCQLGFDRLIKHQEKLKACWKGFETALIDWTDSME